MILFIATACLWAGASGLSAPPAQAPNRFTVSSTAKPGDTRPGTTVPSASAKLDQIQQQAEQLGAYSSASANHQLTTGDVVEVKVYQEDELNAKARVDDEGKIGLPLLGAVKVSGSSVAQAQDIIRSLLEKDYLYSPQVSLTMVEFAKKRFSVLGEVNQPGFFMMPEGETMTVLQAIAMAGGFTPYARSGKIAIKRRINGREEIINVDAKGMAKKERAPTLEIQNGDTIYVNLSIF